MDYWNAIGAHMARNLGHRRQMSEEDFYGLGKRMTFPPKIRRDARGR